MKKVTGLVVAVLLVSGLAVAQGGVGGRRGGPPGTDTVTFDKIRWYTNGFVYYTLTPSEAMTPPVLGFPESPVRIAQAFLAANAEVLGIRQDVSDFSVDGTMPAPLGGTVVLLSQTYQGYPVDDSALAVTVGGHAVTRVEARFISDVSRLRSCPGLSGGHGTPVVSGSAGAQALFGDGPGGPGTNPGSFRAYGTISHFVVATASDVSNGVAVVITDGCTGEVLDGYTEQTNP